MLRTITTSYGPAHSHHRRADIDSGQPIYRAWEYFDLDGHLRSSDPVEAAKAPLEKAAVFLLYAALAVPVAVHYPAVAVLVLAAVALALKMTSRRYGVWHGECPHCREELWIAAKRRSEKVAECRVCSGSVLLESGRFLATFTEPSGRDRAARRGFFAHS
jgi:hypothetical protein